MLSSVVDSLLILIAVLLAVPCSVLLIECFAAVLPGGRESPLPMACRPLRRAVLIPAHNEESMIAGTLRTVMPQLAASDLCLVVADNCCDRTAEVARAHGAKVIERTSDTDHGKGFALAFGVDHLAQDAPDVVIIVDADVALRAGSVDALARLAFCSNRPVQADNIMTAKVVTPIAAVSALAFLVRNRVRARGLKRLGLPCHLTGTGMAFTWDVLGKATPTRASLVEDLIMGLELVRLGHPPMYTAWAAVHSFLPEKGEAARLQRTRWEHGQLATASEQVLCLLREGIASRRPELLALGLDLMVPPLALLASTLGAAWLVMLCAALLEASALPLAIVSVCGVGVSMSVLLAWLRFGRATVPAKYLLAIPHYVLWKLPVYATYLVRGREKKWQRTERESNADAPFLSRVEDPR